MSTIFDEDDYFIPGTRVLKNRLGITDQSELAEVEYLLVASRTLELDDNPSLVSRTFDEAHLKAIHRHQLQDVYDWAGQIRTVPLYKGAPGGFADPGDGSIHKYLEDAAELIRSTSWTALSADQFATQSATVFAFLNQAHPFREGNGRASKVFMQHLAHAAGYELDFSLVSANEWNRASMLSGPDLGAYTPVPDTLVPIFARIAAPRDRTIAYVEGQNEALRPSSVRPRRIFGRDGG